MPPIPGCNSALGILNTDVRHEMVEAYAARLHDVEPTSVGKVVDELAAEAITELAADGVAAAARSLHLSMDLRYRGQAHDLTIALPTVDVSDAAIRAAIADFHAAHLTRYGHALDDDLVELVNVRVTGIGAIPKAAPTSGRPDERETGATGSPDGAHPGHRRHRRARVRPRRPSPWRRAGVAVHRPPARCHHAGAPRVPRDRPPDRNAGDRDMRCSSLIRGSGRSLRHPCLLWKQGGAVASSAAGMVSGDSRYPLAALTNPDCDEYGVIQ